MIAIKKQNDRFQFTDSKTGYPVIWGDDLSISYTLKTDDLNTWERPHDCTPYESRKGALFVSDEAGYVLKNEDLQTTVKMWYEGDILWLELSTALAKVKRL